ncbi:MAG: transcription-repair coupling factor [Desulfamplus sp.]|nr:transcription-repair coupling factor [Desulfamplus sp.]
MLKNFLDFIKEDINKSGKTSSFFVNLTGCYGSSKAYVAAKVFKECATFKKSGCSTVAIFPTPRDAIRFMDELLFFMPEMQSSVLYFPGYHIQPFKSVSYHATTSALRISVLYKLIELTRHYFIITSVDTLLQKSVPKNVLSKSVDIVQNGETLDRDLLVARLNANGYMRTSLVEEPGDYAVRGGILDIFSPNYENPVRIELFGDFVESLRYFSPVTQRGVDEIQEAVIIPPNEVIMEKNNLPHVIARLRQAGSDCGLSPAKVKDYVEKLKELGRFPEIESLISIVYGETDTFVNYLPEDTLFLMDRPEELASISDNLHSQAIENYDRAKQEKKLCVLPESIYMQWSDFISYLDIENRKRVAFRDLVLEPTYSYTSDCNADCTNYNKNFDSNFNLNFKNNSYISAQLQTSLSKRDSISSHDDHILQPLADWFISNRNSNIASVAVCTSDAQAGRLISLLKPYGIELQPFNSINFNNLTTKINNSLSETNIAINKINKQKTIAPTYYMVGNLSSGFVHHESGIAIITDQEIFGVKKRFLNRSTKRAKSRFITPEELKEGDIVVHLEHGLGRYEGLKTITIDGLSGDFIQIAYKDDDRLYLPVDRMEMVEKYIGVEGYNPILDKIGGKTWIKSTAKAKKEVEKMAGELLKLYAERRVQDGHAFSQSDSLYDEFQASFPYDETPDQLKAIDDVLSDMEDETPMDRLVCGDVGYGKTEVAIRAAFKAVNDRKQVAIVVPTTILAEQHLHTFRERFKSWPVTVEALSRFRTTKEQRQILSGLASGKIDIVIGTHRLLQKDVSFKSLGLLVIDEEQRFGVKHKEAIKSKRTTVDVLALTATPIPRTLHLSLTGMRDISVISTPPEDRQAIVSYISEYSDAVVADAVKKELARGGQIFFIHNEIETIFKMVEKLQQLVPEVRIGVAHGRLPEAALEKVMVDFINRNIDMLVCTTIVESGLDIPSANTMIINKAERFGLAQIYQLRGRVGRGEEQAYAYLFVQDENNLSRDAKKRLAALMEHRDLGAGFQIAMKDLQIRGAGSALGASQSGHIAAVGYDMFLKLLDEAVCDLKGKPLIPALEPEINITMSAHIPEDYVQSIEQRLTIYRRLSQMTDISEITTMQKELIDRFGKLPEEGLNMLLKIMLRIFAIKAGVKKMDVTLNSIVLVFSEIHQKRPFRHFPLNGFEYEYTSENVLKINLGSRNKKISRSLVETKKILKEIALYVSPQSKER